MEEKKIRTAVIGVGHLGQHHARVYSELENSNLFCVVDINEEKAREISQKLKVKYYTDYKNKEILDNIDAVSIVVPTIMHYEVAKYFLENKKSVLLEKPITPSVKEAQELVNIARRNKLIFQIGHIERFNSAIISLSKLINEPIFIEANRLGPFKHRGIDVSIVLDLMIHDIDIIFSLVKSKIKKIEAIGASIFTNTEDIANARLFFENGCIANLTASRATIEPVRKIRIFQKDTYFSLDYVQQKINIYKKKNIESLNPSLSILDMLDIKEIKIENEEPLKLELNSFLDCVKAKKRPIVSGEEGLTALETALKICRKIEYINKKIFKERK
ncbi:MAG TPA: Gfo/Idh/MocA family oxidoreductase [bacterium]|nr:Gfo/Idh/MocA family oxidoreductase [bacterium]HOL47804.1 Gfo/Idh/MocA family oxidoreductase [bacterium]HPQ19088.1 Gfo/Idh/MocA family oxidoreductase [bacterium]